MVVLAARCARTPLEQRMRNHHNHKTSFTFIAGRKGLAMECSPWCMTASCLTHFPLPSYCIFYDLVDKIPSSAVCCDNCKLPSFTSPWCNSYTIGCWKLSRWDLVSGLWPSAVGNIFLKSCSACYHELQCITSGTPKNSPDYFERRKKKDAVRQL